MSALYKSQILNDMNENDFTILDNDLNFNRYELYQIALTNPMYFVNLWLRGVVNLNNLEDNLLLQLGKRCVDMGYKKLFHDVIKKINGKQRTDLIIHTLMVNDNYLLGASLCNSDMPIFPPTLDMIKECTGTGKNLEGLMIDWLYSHHWTGEVGKYLFTQTGIPKHKESLVNKIRLWYLRDTIGSVDTNEDLEQLLRLMDKEYYKKMISKGELIYLTYDDEYILYRSRSGKNLKVSSCPCNLQALIYLEDGPSPTKGRDEIYLLLLSYTRLNSLRILLKSGKMNGLEPDVDTKMNVFSYTFLIKNSNVSTSWKFHMNDRDLVQLFLANNKNVKFDIDDIPILPYNSFDLFPPEMIKEYLTTKKYSTLVKISLRGGNTLPFRRLYESRKYDELLLMKYKKEILISGSPTLMSKIKWEYKDFQDVVDDLRPSSIEMYKGMLESMSIRLLTNAFLRNDVFMVEYLYENDVLPMKFTGNIEIGENTPAAWTYLNYGGKVDN